MTFPNTPTFTTLEELAQNLTLDPTNSYLVSYPEFIEYFASIPLITRHHLIIGTHFAYGWMPKILRLGQVDINVALGLLNYAKAGHTLSLQQLKLLKQLINNSAVGLSKLLHFIRPDLYPIWDSNVADYVFNGTCTTYTINKLEVYLDYMNLCHMLTRAEGYEQIHKQVNEKLPSPLVYSMSRLRTFDILLFTHSL